MTASMTIAVPLHKQEDVSPRPLPWRRMAWVTWRQHRAALIGMVGTLAAIAAYTWVVGLQLHHAYAAQLACHPAGSDACFQLTGPFNSSGNLLTNGWILQIGPALIGAFVGAPVLAREMETGTYRYAWTQGFGRWRWTLAKLLGLAVAVTAAAGATSVLFSWYYQPYFGASNQSRGLSQLSSLAPSLFDLRGVAFGAWTLAAFALGALAGILIRRVVPAIVATLAVYTGLAIATGAWLRGHYFAPIVTRSLNIPNSVWVVSQNWTTTRGRVASQSTLYQVLQGAPAQVAGKEGGGPNLHALSAWQYLVQHGYTEVTSYQPATRFWAFQWIEAGWLLGLSVLLLAITLWLVRRRAT
jgi:ABC-type transport system involved in multi-copper enzyme maturation permease subunit